MPPLNPRQEAALTTLDWLLSEGPQERMSGRSYIMAIALVRQAARNPGTWDASESLCETLIEALRQEVDLREAVLGGANFIRAGLSRAVLIGTDPSTVDLSQRLRYLAALRKSLGSEAKAFIPGLGVSRRLQECCSRKPVRNGFHEVQLESIISVYACRA